MPFFSIVIPTYNRVDLLPKTLATVFAQSFQDFEVIVVDDGSTDNTIKVLQELQKTSSQLAYFTQKNSERGVARNKGIQNSTGKYITFLDSDDWLYPDYLQTAFDEITRLNEPAFLHTAYEVVLPDGKVLAKADHLQTDDYKMLIHGNPLSCMGWFLHREKTKRFQFPEDRNIAGSEDWAFALIIVANFGIKTCSKITSALVNHEARSVLSYHEDKLEKRTKSAFAFALQDTKTNEVYGKHKKRIIAYLDAYIALHLAMSKKRVAALRYVWKTLTGYPLFFTERRFWAILKNLL
jgi:glycosyltransferase involved in cell wall biosynthesis